MANYEFTLRLNRRITDEEAEALYEAGCDDAGIETGLTARLSASTARGRRLLGQSRRLPGTSRRCAACAPWASNVTTW